MERYGPITMSMSQDYLEMPGRHHPHHRRASSGMGDHTHLYTSTHVLPSFPWDGAKQWELSQSPLGKETSESKKKHSRKASQVGNTQSPGLATQCVFPQSCVSCQGEEQNRGEQHWARLEAGLEGSLREMNINPVCGPQRSGLYVSAKMGSAQRTSLSARNGSSLCTSQLPMVIRSREGGQHEFLDNPLSMAEFICSCRTLLLLCLFSIYMYFLKSKKWPESINITGFRLAQLSGYWLQEKDTLRGEVKSSWVTNT